MSDPPEEELILTREFLASGQIDALVSAAAPDLRLLTPAERALSLRQTLDAQPADAGGPGVWLFAYGSLIWNPTVRFEERRVATVRGWRRAFCLSTGAGRGTPDNPGLVLGLDHGESCTGVAFRIAPDQVEAELTLLWQREMLSGAYVPRWLDLWDGEVRFGAAIAFTIDPGCPQYAGSLARAEIIRRLATARGQLGSAADYLFRTRDGLRGLNIPDDDIERLSAAVEVARAGRSL